MRFLYSSALLLISLLLVGCGGGQTQVRPPGATLRITPEISTLLPRATQTFGASWKNAPAGVGWSIQEGAAGGEITAQGLYTAPYMPGTYHVVATLQSDPTVQAIAPVTIRVGIAGNGRYLLLDLGAQSPQNGGSVQGINKRGQILFETAFWENGTQTPLAGLTPQARAFNNAGQIVGADFVPGNFGRMKTLAALWATPQSAPTYLPALGGENAFALGINDAGHCVGWASTFTSVDIDHIAGAFWQTSSGVSDLGEGAAVAINNKEELLGRYNQLRRADGVWTSLGQMPGAVSTRGVALNDASQVVGNGLDNAGTPSGFLWENGVLTPLGTLGGSSSSPRSINASGVIVGTSALANGRAHAFVYRNRQMADLNTLVDGASDWEIQDAVSINAAGQIVAHGLFRTVPHDLLLNPQ